MELFGRDKLEARVRRAVGRVLRNYRTNGRRMPPWSKLRKEMIAAVEPELDRVQTDAIRQMFVRFGDGPAPASVKSNSRKRATSFVDDLIRVSKDRWRKIGPRRSAADVADWWKQNFGRQRTELIGATEVAIAHTSWEEIAWRELERQGVRLEGVWKCGKNPCEELCKPMCGKPDKVWRKRFPAGPPSPHPGCNCDIVHKKVGR